ncbi:E3 ubiquitin-protein ligase RNF123 isoform X1 [Homalodisca vitripennis]|nr:E3 ubiquitin-protein ligase RNF123 isoform X1 [Homalodisca vitripennis]XP_046661820.1 E3 ubiquitin-protein ligase RNF123 isoform X1 [Homalodisca vitripennis]
MKKKEPVSTGKRTVNLELHNQLLESDAGIIASHVFGDEGLKTIFVPSQQNEGVSQKLILQNTNVYIHRVLDAIEPSVAACEKDTRPGRLGIPQVIFDSTAQVGTLVMSGDRLRAQSQSNFSTVKANVCFYSGKWQYELHLESKGVMQVGWSMALGEFSPESGVGDTVYSYSFDGNRVRRWNLVTAEYGEPWQVGDVIGCTIDLDVGNMHFYRNGRDLGEAFSFIPLGPGCAYYPAVSLAYEEKLQANFGSTPFKYPISPYLPAQQPPTGAVLRAEQLFHWFQRITTANQSRPKGKAEDQSSLKQSFATTVLLFSEVLMTHLVNLLGKVYVIEACLVPFLHKIANESPDNQGLPGGRRTLWKFNFFCDVLRIFLEPDDLKELIQALCKCLLRQFNQTPDSLDYPKQTAVLEMLSDICQNNYMRRILLKQQGFLKISVPEFMDLKQMDTQALKHIVVRTWWGPMDNKALTPVDEEKRDSYLLWCWTITSKTFELQKQQESFLKLLLTEFDGNAINEATSRLHFLHMFRLFLKDNHVSGLVSFLWNNQNIAPTPLPVALSYFYCLMNVLIELWKEYMWETPHVSITLFFDGSVDYFSLDRLGGVLSHLITTFRAPLIGELGENHRILTEPPPQPPIQPQGLQIQVTTGVDGGSGVASQLTRWFSVGPVQQQAEPPPTVEVAPRNISSITSLMELMDGVILLYHLAAHKQLYKVSTLRDDMDKYIKTIDEAKARLKLAQDSCPEAAAEIEASIGTMERKVDEQARIGMAWVRGTVYTEERRNKLVWLLEAILETLKRASKKGDLFAFVPDFYLESMVEICTALRNYFSPTAPLEEINGINKILTQVAEFLVNLLADTRVVNLASKDTVIEALAGFVAKKVTMECLEKMPLYSQDKFIRMLLKPYDNRPWGQTNWILMRMWQGCGFAFRYKKSPHLSRKLGPRTPSSESGLLIHQSFDPCPSEKYQRLIAKILYYDQEMATEFLNSVLKQLNWSFSEFISMMQEIQNLSKRPERVIIDARQLKICATCFDFVISLLRVVEMICTICLPVFTDSSREGTENLLERLSQLLSQILLRVTSPTGCFTHVISLEVPDLDSIDQFPVLSAVVGVIVALLAEDLKDPEKTVMSPAIKSLLYEPAFQLNTFKYVLGKTGDQENFSLANYPQAVSAEELDTVNKVISLLTHQQTRMSEVSEVDEEELCPICCAMPLAVTFMPCHHRSCKSCITHHLMDCKNCFFCKTAINSVVSNDGKLLFDATASAHKVTDLHPI